MWSLLVVLFDGVQSLDATGPLEVFAAANRWRDDRGAAPAYAIRTASLGGKAVRTSSGLGLLPNADLASVSASPDLLLVPGGAGARRRDPDLVGWLRERAGAALAQEAGRAEEADRADRAYREDRGGGAVRVASVCTGAFLLAEAGLLNGRKVTTHWERCDELAAQYPDVTVDPDPIFIKDGSLATSAGVTAGIDLALALVEDDLGRDAALSVARALVVFLRRPGSQSQFSAQLSGQLADRQRRVPPPIPPEDRHRLDRHRQDRHRQDRHRQDRHRQDQHPKNAGTEESGMYTTSTDKTSGGTTCADMKTSIKENEHADRHSAL